MKNIGLHLGMLALIAAAAIVPLLQTARENKRAKEGGDEELPDAAKLPMVTGIPGLTEGRIVHYVLTDDEVNAGQHRPAMVVNLFAPGGGPTGTAQLIVFRDGTNDQKDSDIWDPTSPLIEWKTSVLYSEEKLPGTWHWIEKA